MIDKIFKVDFNIIMQNIRNDNIEDGFMIFDNFTEKIKNYDLIAVTDYPIRLNAITIIAFCNEGFMKYNMGLKKMSISKNQLHVILSDQIIQTTEISSDFKAGFMVIRRDFLNMPNNFMQTINLHNSLIEKCYFDLPYGEMQEYIKIFEMMKDKIRDMKNHYRIQIVQNYCQITFYNIYNLIANDKKNKIEIQQSNSLRIYEKFIKSVEKNYRQEHNIEFYANYLCLTPKYMSMIISKVSGKHASEWIHEYIILEAKALLKSTDMSFQTISDLLNFSTSSHFGRFFKRYTKYTPNEYRKLK
ncbi:MAG: helix-turn-helix domain-containing protein [Bacteroidales bacterium]|jgi:AraC-like DNA-binding protein|nr:helix-turn-helix domain-containing protein [Bacteroidales bacterium]